MRRRQFITLLGGGAAWPLAVRAQQPALPVIGLLDSTSPDTRSEVSTSAFRQGLSDTGYVEGRNVAIEYRLAEGHYDRLPGLAAELVRRQVSVVFAVNVPAAQAAKAATTTIPIVFSIGGDPIKEGLVARLNSPERNLTGVTGFAGELLPKRLELLRELAPSNTVIAVLVNPNNPNVEFRLRDVQAAADAVGQRILAFNAGTESEIDAAFATLKQQGASALVVSDDPFLGAQIPQLVALAAHYALPTIYSTRAITVGGLISYGARPEDLYRQAGVYVGRILKGEKPADLPVMQPTKFELMINLKTAKALGLTVPLSLQVAADEVIE